MSRGRKRDHPLAEWAAWLDEPQSDGRPRREHLLEDDDDSFGQRSLIRAQTERRAIEAAAERIIREQSLRNLRAYADDVARERDEWEAKHTPEEVLAAREAAGAEFLRTFDPAMWANTDTTRANRATKRRRGRPKGTRSVPRQQIIDVFRSLRTNYGRAPTQAELAANLNPRIEMRTLQSHLTDYDLPWPIE